MMGRRIACPLLGLLLAACAAAGRGPAPADFPDHGRQHGFDLHWRIDRQADAARAVGLVGHPVRQWGHVVLELIALDAAGRTVGFARAMVLPAGFRPVATPFEVALSGAGGAARVELRVVEFFLFERPGGD